MQHRSTCQSITTNGERAEHAVAADRFAREIGPFLKVISGALAAAERQPVGPISSTACSDGMWYHVRTEICVSSPSHLTSPRVE
jgi:hypothetical protein